MGKRKIEKFERIQDNNQRRVSKIITSLPPISNNTIVSFAKKLFSFIYKNISNYP